MLLEKMKIENGRAVTKDTKDANDPFKINQIKIAKATLKMSDIGAKIMGGMTKEEAREVLKKYGIKFTEDADISSLQRQLEQAKREGDTSWAKELEGEIEDLKRENESQAKDADKLIFGHTWAEIQAMQKGTYKAPTIKTTSGKDYGCDPIGNGMYKMVPSGDKVNEQERNKRLGRAKDSSCQIKDISLGGKGYKCMKCGATDVMPGLIKHKAKDVDSFECCGKQTEKVSEKERYCPSCQATWKKVPDGWSKQSKSKDSDPSDITISVNDPDGSLIAFLKGLARTANPGHSFEVIMDPDGDDGPQTFGFDGDGAFRIHSINGSEDFKTEDGWDTPLKEEIRELEEALAVNKRDPNMKNLAARQEEKIKKLKEDLQYKYDHP